MILHNFVYFFLCVLFFFNLLIQLWLQQEIYIATEIHGSANMIYISLNFQKK